MHPANACRNMAMWRLDGRFTEGQTHEDATWFVEEPELDFARKLHFYPRVEEKETTVPVDDSDCANSRVN